MGAGRGRTGGAGGGRGGRGGNANGGGVSGGLGGTDLSAMDDNQLASFVNNAMQMQMPSHLNRNDPTQKLIYAAGWNDKPEVIAAARVEAMAKQPGAVALYRTLIDAGPNLSAKQIADSTLSDPVFKTAGNGARMYGGGMYMANTLNDSRYYGNVARDSNTMGAVLNKKAKIITTDDIRDRGYEWLKQNPKTMKALGYTLRKSGTVAYNGRHGLKADADTQLAMILGYNVVKDRNTGYYTILNRGALTTSNKDYFQSRTSMSGGNPGLKG